MVENETTLSDHRKITYELSEVTLKDTNFSRLKIARTNWIDLRLKLTEGFKQRTNLDSAAAVRDTVEQTTEILHKAFADTNKSRKSNHPNANSHPWWTLAFTIQRKKVRVLRRRYQSHTWNDEGRAKLRQTYKKEEALYKLNIYQAKLATGNNYWEILSSASQFGTCYTIAIGKSQAQLQLCKIKKLDGSFTIDIEDTISSIIDPTSRMTTQIQITRVINTTPTSTLQVLVGALPLDLKADQESKAFRLTHCREKITLGESRISGPEIKECQSVVRDHPARANKIDWRKETPREYGVEIFTDASKTLDQVGAAFVAYDNKRKIETQKIKLSSTASFFQAVAIALTAALIWVNDYLKDKKQPIHVFSDSQSLLRELNSNKPTLLIRALKELINTETTIRTVNINWI
ncbi:hypothetical protein X975_07757, partial [Stegodyphus mimosarum]